MTDEQLAVLLADLESDRVERKRSAADADKIRKAICAFANDLPAHQEPGVVFVGAEDNGSCAGIEVTDKLLRTLSDMRSHGTILPLPTLTVQKRTLRGCELAVVVVHPADAPPVRYNGRVFVRVGPTTRVATPEEERRLAEKRRAGDLPFDIHPVRSATLDDLDLELFRREYLPATVSPEILEGNERSVEEQLVSTRMATTDTPPTPTVLGVLTLGKDPRWFIPGSYVQFLRIEGVDLADPIKAQREIGGPLPDLLRRLDDMFEAHISVASDITSGPVEVRRADYPIVALQQLARNAVLHRTYDGTHAPARITWFSDRIEIQNPGGPYGQVTRENFGTPGITGYRNPDLAAVMKDLGYVQRFGVGIPMARKALSDNGNPPPEFATEATYTLVTLRRPS